MCNNDSLRYNKMIPVKISSTALLEVSILYFLKELNVPTYGTQILQRIDETFGKAWGPSHSNLYILLSEMESAQYIKSVYSDNKRVFYMIAPLGIKRLEEKLQDYKDTLKESKRFFDNIILSFYGEEVIL